MTVRLTSLEATDPAKVRDALERAAAAGVALVIEPPGDKNIYLTKAQAADHPTWVEAKKAAEKQGGTVVTLET